MNLLQSINRHALDLERAIDYETTTGQVCIPNSIRESPLYSSLMKGKMPAIRESGFDRRIGRENSSEVGLVDPDASRLGSS